LAQVVGLCEGGVESVDEFQVGMSVYSKYVSVSTEEMLTTSLNLDHVYH